MSAPVSRKTKRAIAAYGADKCRRAYRMLLDGRWEESIATALELTTMQARAAADAGRELCTEPLDPAMMKGK